jgi:hypothetical protein
LHMAASRGQFSLSTLALLLKAASDRGALPAALWA